MKGRILLNEGRMAYILLIRLNDFWINLLIFTRSLTTRFNILIRFSGTIVGVEDISLQWKDSKWRSLKVNTSSWSSNFDRLTVF